MARDISDRKTREMVLVRAPFNYDADQASLDSGIACEDPSLAHQSFAEDADINTIVRRFGLTGELPSGVVAPVYGDFSGVVDFHSAMNAIAKANESFDAMPAEVRYRFGNDPGRFVEFCSDPANQVEAENLGLVFKSPEPTLDRRVAASSEAAKGEVASAGEKPA